MTEVAEAETLIASRMPRWPAIDASLEQAHDRVLAETVTAERDQPPFDRVTMDGIALSYDDWAAGNKSFAIRGTQAAGKPQLALGTEGGCIEVMTGAMLPAGTDAVVPVERLRVEDGVAMIAADTPIEAGQFIHRQGSDGREGDVLLTAGMRLGPAEIAVAASAGRAKLAVAALAEVAVISTGDELIGMDEPIEAHQIRSSNEYTIAASLERAGLARVTRTRLADDAAAILDSITALHAASDALILSGGVSMGQFDFVPAALDALGCELVFHRINQKPGRPMWFGISADSKPVFALPGNPVSTLLCMTRYVVPALRLAAGIEPKLPELARLTADVSAPKSMTYFVPVTVVSDGDGMAMAEPHPTNTSGDFITLAGKDGFLELAAGQDLHVRGTVGRLYRW